MSSDVSPYSRRRFLLKTAATTAGTLIAACTPEFEVERVDAANIPVDGGVVIGSYVVMQPEEGKFAAFSSSYPHQSGRISEVSNGMMICPNRNSQSDIAIDEVVTGPLHKPASQAPLSAEGTELTVGQKQALETD